MPNANPFLLRLYVYNLKHCQHVRITPAFYCHRFGHICFKFQWKQKSMDLCVYMINKKTGTDLIWSDFAEWDIFFQALACNRIYKNESRCMNWIVSWLKHTHARICSIRVTDTPFDDIFMLFVCVQNSCQMKDDVRCLFFSSSFNVVVSMKTFDICVSVKKYNKINQTINQSNSWWFQI